MVTDDMEAAEVRVTQLLATTCRTATDYAVFGLAGRLAVAQLQGMTMAERIVALAHVEHFFTGLKALVSKETITHVLQEDEARTKSNPRPVVHDYGFDSDD